MIRHKWYRGLQVIFGARSFVKNDGDSKTFLLIKGNSSELVSSVMEDGFVEEWGKK